MFHIVTPAWTLSIELSFYLIAPFVVRRHFLLLALSAFALQAIRYQAYHVGWLSYGTDNRFFPFELGLFLYGALLHEGLAMIVGALLFIRTIAEQRITDR